jgi:hypothetical protein
VEHACYQCGTEVEDGRPFCPHCRAPQIQVRVAVAEPATLPAGSQESLSADESARDENFPVAYGSFGRIPANRRSSTLTVSSIIEPKFAVGAALKAGLIGVFLGIIPLLGVVLTGALAVYFYRRASKTVPVALAAARLGGAAGVVVFAVNSLLMIPIILFHAQQQTIDSMTEMMRKYGLNTDTAQFQASLHAMFSPSGLLAFFVVTSVLSSLGGALASFFLRPDK